MQTRQRLIEQIIRNILLESNAEENVDRQFELGRMSGYQAFTEPNKPKPSPKPKKPRTREEKQEIARQRQAAIQAAIDAENHSRAVSAGFPNWNAYMDSYRNDPRMGRLKQTNESNLNELYSFAGLYARSIGNKRQLSPEEQARGENPYLTPEGKTTYPTGPLANVMGKQMYVQGALASAGEMDKRFVGLKQSTQNLINSIESGKIKTDTPEDLFKLTNPRMDQINRIVGKMAKRTATAGRVVQDARNQLSGLPKPKPPEEPPHYFG